MQEFIANLSSLKRDYPQFTFQLVFNSTVGLTVNGRTKTVTIPLDNLSIKDIRTRLRLFTEID